MKQINEKKKNFFIDKEKEKKFRILVRDHQIKDASEILELYGELAVQLFPSLMEYAQRCSYALGKKDFGKQDAEDVVSESIYAGFNFLKAQLSSNYEGKKRLFQYNPDITLFGWLKIIIYNKPKKFGILIQHIKNKSAKNKIFFDENFMKDNVDESQNIELEEKIVAVSEGIEALKDKSQKFLIKCRYYGVSTENEVVRAALSSGYCKDESVRIGTRAGDKRATIIIYNSSA